MSKFKELKNYVKEHMPQIVGTTAGIIAVILVCVIIIILNSEARNDSGQIETTKKQALETTIKNEETKEAVTKQTKATTKTDGTTTEETNKEEDTTEQVAKKQEETKKQEAATNVQVVTTQQHTTTKTQTVIQPTTKKQEDTKKKQETPTTPPRGKNGVILEELSFALYNMNTGVNEKIPVPKTYTEFKNSSSEEESGYVIVYNHPAVKQNDIFYNELEFRKSTKQDVINIYGKPLTTYSTVNGEFLVYQYGYYTNMEVDKIYIIFGFAKKLDMRFGGIQIGNVDIIN